MNIGFMCGMAKYGHCSIDEFIQEIQAAEAMGFDQAWMGQVFGHDAISIMSLAGRETSTIRLGTAVTPSYPRHPTSLALQCMTASAASGGRFDLGLGLSHKIVIEDMYGIPYEKPAAHMREYLNVLTPLLRGEPCDFKGELYQVNAKMKVLDAEPVPVIVAALGPKMLEVAGSLADGTTTWMTGPKTLENHTIPTINAAAQKAGKPKPRIVASFPIVLTNDRETALEAMTKNIEVYGYIPSYSKMLAMEGVDSPMELAIAGDEKELTEKLSHLKDIGVSDFNAFCMAVDDGAVDRTMAWLADMKKTLS